MAGLVKGIYNKSNILMYIALYIHPLHPLHPLNLCWHVILKYRKQIVFYYIYKTGAS